MIRTRCRKRRHTIDMAPIKIERVPLITKDSKILTIGSCFAYEIKNYLLDKGYWVFNRHLPDQLLWYNTASILYEFERLTGEFIEDDHWQVTRGKKFKGKVQDPYRRLIFADTPSELRNKTVSINRKMAEFISTADVVILTLGLTEQFRNTPLVSLKTINACPGYMQGAGYDATFRQTFYLENFKNINKSMGILKSINHKVKVIITVSPVALANTFRNVDHIIANTESKSILRAVAGEIAHFWPGVYYFHSYELALNHVDYPAQNVFQIDGRHVEKGFVKHTIMPEFEKAFVE